MIFFLKSRCGWREADASSVNVNGGADGVSVEALQLAEKERIARQRELISLLAPAELRQYAQLMRAVAERAQARAAKPASATTIEVRQARLGGSGQRCKGARQGSVRLGRLDAERCRLKVVRAVDARHLPHPGGTRAGNS